MDACVVLVFILICAIAQAAWVHPGVLMNKAQLDFMKQKVIAKENPWYTSYTNALKTSIGKTTYKPQGPPANKIISCGFDNDPTDVGCDEDKDDGSAANLQALLWYINGNRSHAQLAITLLNRYAGLLKYNNSAAPLFAGWSSLKFTRAAEIIRYTNAGWSTTDFNNFVKMMYRAYIPQLYGGSTYNGNWELSMIDGLFGIAVVSENTTLLNRAVEMWQQRVPAYFYNSQLDGNQPVPAPRGNPSWYGQVIFDDRTTGVAQETCRDLMHTQMGMNSALNAAETAYLQGVDLYGQQQERLVTSMELAARLLVNQIKSNPYLCNTTVPVGRNTGTFEIGYNHYHNRKGILMNETYTHIILDVRTIINEWNTLTNVFETLTHAGGPDTLAPGNGLTGKYYSDLNFTSLVATRIDPTINFDFGAGTPSGITGLANDRYTIRWTGKIIPRCTASYTFFTRSDDGVRLYVHMRNIINDWTVHSAKSNNGTISLTAGIRYSIQLDYQEVAGDASVALWWQSECEPKAIIPQRQLYSS